MVLGWRACVSVAILVPSVSVCGGAVVCRRSSRPHRRRCASARSVMFRASAPPDSDQSDIAYALDALSCVESGDRSVLELIARAAFDLDPDECLSEETEDDDDDEDEEDEEDDDFVERASEGFSVESLSVADLSSALSSHQITPSDSKLYGGFINVSNKLEPQQTGQFLLPLITSQSQNSSDDSKFIIKHEGILQVLAESSKDFLKLEAENYFQSMNLEDPKDSAFPDDFVSDDMKNLPRNFGLLDYDKIFAAAVMPLDNLDYDSINVKEETSADTSKEIDFVDCESDEIDKNVKLREFGDVDVDVNKEDYAFLNRKCCEDASLANGGWCPNLCHSAWKFIEYGVQKYVTTPSIVENLRSAGGCTNDNDSESTQDGESVYDSIVSHDSRTSYDSDVPQMVFDCDSIDTRKRFVYDEDSARLCPGGCANRRPCKKFLKDATDFEEPEHEQPPPSQEFDERTKHMERDIKFIDIQAAWYEMKILTLWFYWAFERRLGDLLQVAVGFQVPCNCCYCAHVNVLSRMQRLKDFNVAAVNEDEVEECTCDDKKVASVKVRIRMKPNDKMNFVWKDSTACSRCSKSGDKKDKNATSDRFRINQYYQFLGLKKAVKCCCTQSTKPTEHQMFPVVVCSKDPEVSSVYVDLMSGNELSEDEVNFRVDKSVRSFYSKSRKHWIKIDGILSKEEEGELFYDNATYVKSPLACERCRCTCSQPKFYNFCQIVSRMAAIIDNFTRISMTFLVYKMDDLFSALCARYSARLLIFFDARCEFTFLLELARVVHVFKDADLWLMAMLGEARCRIVSTLFTVLPGQQFLKSIYKWADAIALDVFLKLCMMLTHDMLPPDWKDVLLFYADILSYVYDAETLSDLGEKLAFPRSDIDKDEDFIKMHQRYYCINEKYLSKGSLGNVGNNNCNILEDLLTTNDPDVIKFCYELSEELQQKTSEVAILFQVLPNGWNNFEKLVIFSMIKACATDDYADFDFINYQIDKALDRFNNYLNLNNLNSVKPREGHEKTKTPLQKFIESTENSKFFRLPFEERNERSLRKDYLMNNFKKESFKELARIIYFKLSKRCLNDWMNSFCFQEVNRTDKRDDQSKHQIKENSTIKEIRPRVPDHTAHLIIKRVDSLTIPNSEFFDSIHNSTYSSVQPKSVLVQPIRSTFGVDLCLFFYSAVLEMKILAKHHNIHIFLEDYVDAYNQMNLLSKGGKLITPIVNIEDWNFEDFRKSNECHDLLDRLLSEKGLIPNTFRVTLNKESGEVLLNDSVLDKRKSFILIGQVLSAPVRASLNEKMIEKLSAKKAVEDSSEPKKNIKPSEEKEPTITVVDKDVHRIKIKLNCGKDDCNLVLPRFFENFFLLDQFEQHFQPTREEVEILCESYNIIYNNGVYDKCEKMLDGELANASHLWDPCIEEVEDELLKLERKKKTKEEFQQDLCIVCFKLVTRNMMEDLIPTNENVIERRKRHENKARRNERRIIDGHCVEDFWSSIQSQFVGWRNMAMKMYLDVVRINKSPGCKGESCGEAKLSSNSDDPVKTLAVKKSVASKICAKTSKNSAKTTHDSKEVTEESWCQAFSKFRSIKTSLAQSSSNSSSTPSSNKLSKETTREAELLGGLGLVKMLNQSLQRLESDQANSKAKESKNAEPVKPETKDAKIVSTKKTLTKKSPSLTNIQSSAVTSNEKCSEAAKPKLNEKKETTCKKSLQGNTKDTTKEYKSGCSGTCKHDHFELVRSSHQQPNNDHPCNCCYCTIFGHAPSVSASVPRNYNERRERLRTLLNKKKQNSQSNSSDQRSSTSEPEPQENQKSTQQQADSKLSKEKQTKTSTASPVLPQAKQKAAPELSKNKSKLPSDEQHKPDTPKNPTPNEDPPKSKKSKKSTDEAKVNPVNPIARTQSNSELNKKSVNNNVKSEQKPKKELTRAEKHELLHTDQSFKCHSCSRSDSKSVQTEESAKSKKAAAAAPSDGVDSSKISKVINNQKPNAKLLPKETKPAINTTAPVSRDSSFCTSSACSNCSEYKVVEDDTRDINMLIKFIEEPLQGADKEKKQAKKARQKFQKLEMKLLKERHILHEDLISMAGETSLLHEEVVRLERGLSSACCLRPTTNKSKNSGASDNIISKENHDRVMMLKQAAQEASAHATKAASLAEHTQSRLRDVESKLSLISLSVSKACLKQLDEQTDKDQSKAKNSTPSPSYGDYQTKYEYNSGGKGDQGMVTIKRVMVPNSEEPRVLITPKGALIYRASKEEASDNQTKPTQTKKQTLSWESTIAQINALAQSSKKSKDTKNNAKKEEAKPAKKTNDVSTDKKPQNGNKNVTPPISNDSVGNKKNKKDKNANKEPETISTTKPNSDKKTKKSEDANNKNKKNDKEAVQNSKNNVAATVAVNNNSVVTQKKKKGNKDPDSETKTTNNAKKNTPVVDIPPEAPKTNKKNKNKQADNKSNNESAESEKNKSKKAKEVVNQQDSSKAKKSQSQNNPPKASQQQNKSNQNSQMHIVNSLSSTMDKIRLNDDTTIELASSAKKDSFSDGRDSQASNGSKASPVSSSSIVEQLKCGVQFADLRLPPGITLTRVDPAKQHFAPKPNIPLVSSTTSTYRPTPPPPPTPAVIMVDTTKLHADRESKLQAEQPKTGKSKKSKKKSKKAHQNNSTMDEPTKMVTLRNPMFHPTLASGTVPALQPTGSKCINDIRIPEPIPMPPNASCQATITPTSNGMYTIRNPLMSIVHQQSMMGMGNPLENTVGNPLLLHHLNAQPYVAESPPKNKEDPKVKSSAESVADITKRLSEFNVDDAKSKKNKNQDSSDKKKSADNVKAASPMGNVKDSYSNVLEQNSHKKPLEVDNKTNGNSDSSQPAEHPRFYTLFGPADTDRSYNSMHFQPYSRNTREHENTWMNKQPENRNQEDNRNKFHYFDKDPSMVDPTINNKPDVQNHDGVNPDPSKFFANRQPVYPYYSYEVSRDATSHVPKFWNSQSYASQDYSPYYNNMMHPGIPALYQPSSSSSSCVFSGSSSVYDSVSNSSSNSPADAPIGANFEGFRGPRGPEYPYNPLQQHHHGAMKSSAGMYKNMVDPFGRNFNGSMNDPGKMENSWNGCCQQFNSVYESEDACKAEVPKNHGAIGSQRTSNGLKTEAEYFADNTTSVFAPNQTITNLNELDSSERDIESFKRFDFYFEPPKNKPKISLNVQDIALQRPNSTKLYDKQ